MKNQRLRPIIEPNQEVRPAGSELAKYKAARAHKANRRRPIPSRTPRVCRKMKINTIRAAKIGHEDTARRATSRWRPKRWETGKSWDCGILPRRMEAWRTSVKGGVSAKSGDRPSKKSAKDSNRSKKAGGQIW